MHLTSSAAHVVCFCDFYTIIIIKIWVLWHCWLGGRKGIRPVKKWGMMEVGTG